MPRKLPECLREEDVETLIRSSACPRRKALFIICFYEGLRVSEVGALTQEHINHDTHMLRIVDALTPSGKPKKQVERIIPIFREAEKALEYVPFKVGTRALQYWYEEQTKLIFGKKGHIHTLRHSCASWLLNVQGWGINDVRDHLGHANIASTQTYAQAYPEKLVKMARGC